jgi:hypothetical protein
MIIVIFWILFVVVVIGGLLAGIEYVGSAIRDAGKPGWLVDYAGLVVFIAFGLMIWLSWGAK